MVGEFENESELQKAEQRTPPGPEALSRSAEPGKRAAGELSASKASLEAEPGQRNREIAFSKLSLVRIVQMGQDGFQKKKTFGTVTRRRRTLEQETMKP